MWSSRFYFSLSATVSIVGLICILVALTSENWIAYQVNRREILNAFNREPDLNIRLKDAFNKNTNYFSRSNGIFFVCFPDFLPSESGTFTKPVTGAHCLWSPEYFPSEAVQEQFTQQQTYHLWLTRGTALLFLIGIVCVLFCLFIGILGSCTDSTKLIGWAIVLSLLAVLMTAGAMVCWHFAQYLESSVLDMAPYFRSWEPVLKSTTRSHLDWGYVIAWFGIGFLFASLIILTISRSLLKKEHERELCAKQGYIMPNYFDKSAAMVPYSYNTYGGGYGGYPYYTQGYNTGYFGYMNYGR